jgi:hypothetical protein
MSQGRKTEVARRLQALGLEPGDEDLEALVRALPRLEGEQDALGRIGVGQREPAFVFRPLAVES